MKNIQKSQIFKLLLVLVFCLSMSISTVSAETAPSTFRATHYTFSNPPMSYPATFHIKKTTGGRYVYCTYYAKNTPVKNVVYSKGSLVKDNGINYILNESYDAKSDNSFFIYQTALWIYMVDKGIMPQPYYDLTVFKSRVNNSDASTAKKIKTLVANAKKAGENDSSKPTISANTSGVKFSLDSEGKYYVTSAIKVTSSTGKFKASIVSAPSGTKYSVEGKKLYIKVPKSSVTSLNTPVKLKLTNSKTVYHSYYYNPSDSTYQIMAMPFKETLNASTKISLSIKGSSSIEAIKVDEEGKALSGATLQVTNDSGSVIDSWVTDGNNHKISNLSAGTYILKETKAPVGYKLSTEQVKFVVDANGNVKDANGNVVTLLTFKNEKNSVTVSKQDIANSSELPGATLVINNSDGKEIVKWTSSTKPYVIRGLAAGTYTLTETIAPDGYTKSTESITFKIGDDGKIYDADGKTIDKVIMYNKKTDTPGGASISKKDATTGSELPGATLVVKDYDGKEIDTWVSTDKPHVIENLKPGIYTLTETIAPDGYILSTETVTFTIKDDGSVTPVVMYNSPNSKDVPKEDTPSGGGEEVPVESTGSYKTIASTVIGSVIIFVGGIVLLATSKRKED